MLLNWLKIAFANYKKNWLSTLINLFGLTLGLTGFILILLYWNHEKSFEKWNPNKDHIYFIENQIPDGGVMPMSSTGELKESPELFPEIESSVIFTTSGKIKLKSGNKSFYGNSAYVNDGFFDCFPLQILAGNPDNAFKEKNSIAISTKVAQTIFGNNYQDAIGKVLKDDVLDKQYIVRTVYDNPYNTFISGDYFVRTDAFDEKTDWANNYSYYGFFKLKPNIDISQLEKKLTSKMISEMKKLPFYTDKKLEKEVNVFLTPLSQLKFNSKSKPYDATDTKNLNILTVLTFLVLLLSCINIININTALASKRAKEVGVKKAIGATRKLILAQFIFETFLLILFSLILSMAFIELILPFFNRFMDVNIAINFREEFPIFLAVLIVVSVSAGLIPSLYISKYQPILTLKGNFSRSSNGIWLRNFILCMQIIFSSFFIICSLVVHNQVKYMMQKDLGFSADQIIHIDFKTNNYKTGENRRKYELMKTIFRQNPGVQDVTYGFSTIGKWIGASSIMKSIPDTTKTTRGGAGGIDLNYFKMFRIPILEGRDFDEKLASDTASSVVLNQKITSDFGWSNKDAVGKKIQLGFNGKNYEVIGVAKDFNISGVSEQISPMVFFYYGSAFTKNNMNGIDIKLKAENIDKTLKQIQNFWEKEIEPDYPFEYYFVDKEFAKTFEKYQKQQTLFTILNIIVLTVALLGLFALSSLLIEQKLKDVAIKKILGASEKSIVLDLTKKFLIISAFAVLISIPISYYFMNEWLKDFAYRIDMPWFPYVLSFVILLLLTFAVVSIKAYRATQVNLVKYLKYE